MRTSWLTLVSVLTCACASGATDGATSNTSGSPPSSGDGKGTAKPPAGGSSGTGQPAAPKCTGDCTDFPEQPIVEADASEPITDADIARFAPKDFAAASFCLMEPQLSTGSSPGALFPSNWLRPRFRWEGGAAGALYEIRLHSAGQRHDLVAYTRKSEWAIPRELWEDSAAQLGDIKATVRALASDGKISGVEGSFAAAPIEAGGSMVFWATSSSEVGKQTSKLRGFAVGDEAVVEALNVGDVMTTPMIHENGRDLRGEFSMRPGFLPGEVQCIGCHVGTPDGAAVVFTDDYPWPKVISSITAAAAGTTPSYVSAGAQALLKQPWLGVQTMTSAHWKTGDRILVSSYANRTEPFSPQNSERDRLVWFDLETTAVIPSEVPSISASMPPNRDDMRKQRNDAITAAKGSAWDLLAMDGETANAVTPSFSNDGKRIAYVSTDKSPNGHSAYEANVADVKIVPYNDRKGGAVKPLQGASSPDWYEYYPSFSPDDRYLTFTRAPKKGSSPDGPYYNRNGEIYVIASDGSGEPVRLMANDPPACSNQKSPGVLNSWSKWSPKAREQDGKTYYFLIFSSARKYPDAFDIPRSMYTPSTLDTRSSQLYMTAFVVDGAGKITSYPAVYLWNQNRLQEGMMAATAVSTSNLTPAWAEFELPPVVVF
jgi:hypothetical protein